MTVETGGAGEGYTGFKAAPVDVTMSRGGSAATASVFVYDSADDAQGEWDLVPGSRPAPKAMRTDPGGLGPDALDGLINLGG
jgi:hypothetical protein